MTHTGSGRGQQTLAKSDAHHAFTTSTRRSLRAVAIARDSPLAEEGATALRKRKRMAPDTEIRALHQKETATKQQELVVQELNCIKERLEKEIDQLGHDMTASRMQHEKAVQDLEEQLETVTVERNMLALRETLPSVNLQWVISQLESTSLSSCINC